MGCPILLGYAEKAKEVSQSWAEVMVTDEDYPPDMVRDAMRARSPFKDLLERRARVALQAIISDMLKRALTHSEMRADAVWLDELPSDLEPVATTALLQRFKDRAIAWHVSHGMEQGKVQTEGELEMVFTERVWEILNIADNLLHDMAQESYTVAGTALAFAMAAVKVDTAEWLQMFRKLEEVA